jgi:predicted nucleotidyltransferase
MENIEPVDAATRVIKERFHGCRNAFLSRSVLTSRRTPTSDLDIVVILDGPPAPYRETIRSYGWIVELFIHSRESLLFFYDFDAQSGTCTLAQMCADGHVLRSFADEATEIQDEARNVIAKGPPALTDEEREQRRYRLTDLLDDFLGSSDSVELAFIASRLVEMAGELVLRSERRWTGEGKWLAHHLDAAPDDFANRLVHGLRSVLLENNKQPMIDSVSATLDLAGGPLTEGFIAFKPVE